MPRSRYGSGTESVPQSTSRHYKALHDTSGHLTSGDPNFRLSFISPNVTREEAE